MWVPQPVERWIEPEEIVHRQRRRRGRWRALRHAVVLLLIILAVGGVGVAAGGAVLGRWDLPWSPGAGEQAAPSADASAVAVDCEPAVVTPAGVEGTSVEVLNATTRSGLAGTVADELEVRGFTVVDVGNFAGAVAEPAQVRFPAGAEPAALVVAAHLEGAVVVADDQVAVVTAVLGDGWTGVATVDQAVATAQQPQPSVVACAAGTPTPPPATVG